MATKVLKSFWFTHPFKALWVFIAKKYTIWKTLIQEKNKKGPYLTTEPSNNLQSINVSFA
jgi:hypothetical protein